MERQAWSRKGELDRVVLEHARAMLLVLAALVDRAAGLPTFERLHFLAVMGHGEAEARRLIVAMASERMPAAPSKAVLLSGADPCSGTPVLASSDVALLAARFRMLALAVEAMLAQTSPQPLSRHAPAVLPPDRNSRRKSQFIPSPALRATSPPHAGGGTTRLGAGAHPAWAPLPRGERWFAKQTGEGVLPRIDAASATTLLRTVQAHRSLLAQHRRLVLALPGAISRTMAPA